MAALDDIKSSLDVNQIAGLLGTDPQTAEAAVDTALGSLLRTMGSNVDHEADAVSLASALGQHDRSPAYGNSIDLDAIDTEDGRKIVGHVFSPDQVQQLATSRQGGLIEKLLPLLAPVVMAYLAKRFNGYLNERMGGAQAPAPAPEQSGGGLGDLLGSILGGGQASQAQPPAAPAPSTFPPASVPSERPDGLRMDPGDGSRTTNPSAQGNVLGGILKDILLGGR